MYLYACFWPIRLVEGKYLAVRIVRIVRKTNFNNSTGLKLRELLPYICIASKQEN